MSNNNPHQASTDVKKDSPKISVIMASKLSHYEGAASNRTEKFRRAVNSFLYQDYPNKELIIVSDGCEITTKIYLTEYIGDLRIHLVTFKEPNLLYSGNIRNAGISRCRGEIVCYLDTDDIFGQIDHLSCIVNGMQDYSFIYFNDRVAGSADLIKRDFRGALLQQGAIGTSCIAHRKDVLATWTTGYSHDWVFIKDLIFYSYENYERINGPSYLVCHIPNTCDF